MIGPVDRLPPKAFQRMLAGQSPLAEEFGGSPLVGCKQGGGKVVEALQAAQQEAFKGRRGLWEYGDPGDDSDDEPTRRWGR